MRSKIGLVALAALCLSGTASIASGNVPRVYRAIVPTLRKVAFPVLLPTELDGARLRKGDIFPDADADAHHYEVQFNLTPDCRGADACSNGSFAAYDATYRKTHTDDLEAAPTVARTPTAEDRQDIASGREILDRPTRLRGGTIGYYSESISGAADGGTSSIRWMHGGVVYELYTRVDSQKSLAAAANSAIENGPLF
jgi:hypothetical protein